MDRNTFISLMQVLAPLELAETWDNVGVLIESTPRAIERVLLTIDLTEEVLEEAIEFGAQAIVAYHPPIFSGLKRLLHSAPTGRIVARALTLGILVYSPHTALDSVPGGVNDWLASAFAGSATRAISAAAQPLTTRVDPGPIGQGRFVTLREAMHLTELVQVLKQHLKLTHVRLSQAAIHEHAPVSTIAVCAGSGGSVIIECEADLYLTGEMRHHDVLASKMRGTSVILTDHTNTERGYLPVLRQRMLNKAAELDVRISQHDHDPLYIV